MEELTWEDAMRRGYEALRGGEALYEEIDAEQEQVNIDIEKHLRRAAQAPLNNALACHGAGAGLATRRLAVGRHAEHRGYRHSPQTSGGGT